MTLQDDGTYTFKDYHGKYLTVKQDLGLGTSTDINIYAKFWITRKANVNKICIKGVATWSYLKADNGSGINTRAYDCSDCADAERFSIELV